MAATRITRALACWYRGDIGFAYLRRPVVDLTASGCTYVIEMLHFLRPMWLIALPAIVLIWWLVRRREASQAGVGEIVAPHLREALTVNKNMRKGIRAVDGVCIASIFAALAAAGSAAAISGNLVL